VESVIAKYLGKRKLSVIRCESIPFLVENLEVVPTP
jgi:hypothetical protein